MKRFLSAAFGFIAATSGYAAAQSKIEAPRTISGRNIQTISPEQVRTCLFLAKEISDLTDRANVAKSRADTETFNSTVDPYNSATVQWNSGCTKAYNPADMIRAENENGMRLCKFTSTPCLSEAERKAILAREATKQKQVAPSSVGLHKSTGRVRAPVSNDAPSGGAYIAPEDAGYGAWYLSSRYKALNSAYRGVPASSLSFPLQKISVLSCDAVPKQFTAEQCGEIARNGLSFRASADLNHDGKLEVYETAVGKSQDGTDVGLLIVSDQLDPKINQIFSIPANVFSAVLISEEQAIWADCMECSIGINEIAWNETERRFFLRDYKGNELRSDSTPDAWPAVKEASVTSDVEIDTAFAFDRAAEAVAKNASQERYGSPGSGTPEEDAWIAHYEEVYLEEVARRVMGAYQQEPPKFRIAMARRIEKSRDIAEDEVASFVADIIVNGGILPDETRQGRMYKDGFYHAYRRRLDLDAVGK